MVARCLEFCFLCGLYTREWSRGGVKTIIIATRVEAILLLYTSEPLYNGQVKAGL